VGSGKSVNGSATNPRLVIAGMSGDSGKTLFSLGLLLALRDRGFAVRAFKKGPITLMPPGYPGPPASRPATSTRA